MRKLPQISFLTLISIFIAQISFAQNLIPNPDFELGPNQSTIFGGWGASEGPDLWIVTKNSPDRIYYGSIAQFRDNDSAQSGLAYVIFYGQPFPEAGKATLLSPLQVGATYHLIYHLDIDTNFYDGSGGIVFNFNNGGDSIYSPLQINTGKWERYDTTFVASASSTEIEILGIGNALVKVDSISLELDTPAGIINYIKTDENISIFPNPTNGKTAVFFNFSKNTDAIMRIYNLLGILMGEHKFNGSFNIVLSNLKAGIYIVIVTTSNKRISEKLVITN